MAMRRLRIPLDGTEVTLLTGIVVILEGVKAPQNGIAVYQDGMEISVGAQQYLQLVPKHCWSVPHYSTCQ